MNRFSTNLKILRENNNLKQTELAKKLNISSAAYSNYETGRREPNIEILLKISDLFNVSVDDLITKNNLPLIEHIIKDEKNNSIYNIEEFNMISVLKEKQKYYTQKKISINKLIDSQLDEINYWIKLLESTNNISNNQEISEEISPNIIDFPKKEPISYRTINIAGEVSAGTPCYSAEEIIGTVNVPSKYLCSSKTYFALKIKGDSMNKLFDVGSLVLVEQSNHASNSSIIIAFTEDDEATIKRIKFNKNTISLVPESTNPKHQTLNYRRGEILVVGTVLGPIEDFLDD